jgi:Cu-Zn family superoxide dismutase
MKRLLLTVMCTVLIAPALYAAEATLTVNKLTQEGVGDAIGVILIEDTAQGLRLQPHLRDLPPGVYAFTVNETMACHGHMRSDGKMVPGLAAGEPVHQLPQIEVNNQGIADQAVIVPGVSLKDISGRSLVISRGHGGVYDRTSGESGGNRIACASAEQY